MMTPHSIQITETHETTSTDFRDRVDRIAAAILAGWWASHTQNANKLDMLRVAKGAIRQIEAIDAAIAEGEREKQIKEVELMARLREQEALK